MASQVRNCFSISKLMEWREDPARKGEAEAIDKRITVLMDMAYLKANEEKLGEEALTALRRFEATHRPEFQADRQRQISEANAVSYTHLPSPRDQRGSRMPSSA